MPSAPAVMPAVSALETATLKKVTWRLIPFLMLCYFIAYVDRVNVGFAALQMNKDVGLSSSQFGFGGAVFFISYFFLEVPSNLIMQKVGARVWIARIMITWGIIAGCMALVVGPKSFYGLRFLLGAAEAGFFPGVILYLTYWFPAKHRARIIAIFMVAIPASSFIGSPISAALLGLHGTSGLRGWQWMFIVEAVPAVILGVLTLAVLRNGPNDAKWLLPEERAWLVRTLEGEMKAKTTVPHSSLWRVLSNPYVLVAAIVYAGGTGASVCLSIWQPQIIKSFGLTNMQTGLLNSVPFGVASVAMVLWGRHSDRTRERVWHTAIPSALIAVSLVAAGFVGGSLAATIVILCAAVIGTYCFKGPFWALSTGWLAASSAAAGIAQINAIGNLGGFVGTYLLGVIKDRTHSYALGLLPLAFLTAAGAIGILVASAVARRGAAAVTSPSPH